MSHVSGQSNPRRDQRTATGKIYDAPREERKSLEFAHADMRTITKLTQVLDLIKKSGYRVNGDTLEQLLFYNKTDVNFKTLNMFEPSKAYAKELLKEPLERVGEHPSYSSDAELQFDEEAEKAKEEAAKHVNARDKIA